MAPPTLDSLTPELQLTIIDFIRRPSDLKSICLTCSSLRRAATPGLYRRVFLNLENCKLPVLHGFFIKSNEGRAYTKSLMVTPPKPTNAHAWTIIRLAIELLPQDGSRSLCLPADLPLDLGSLLLLSIRQRRIERLGICTTGDAFEEAQSCLVYSWDWLQALRHVSLPPVKESVSELDIYHQMLLRTPQLLSLSIRTNKLMDKAPTVALHDNRDSNGFLTRKVLELVEGRSNVLKLRLTELVLRRQLLRFAERTFAQLVDFPRLVSLTLHKCRGLESFLPYITRLHACCSPALRRLRFAGDITHSEALNQFIDSFRGLEVLHINYTDDDELGEEGAQMVRLRLKNHASTLRCLAYAVENTLWTEQVLPMRTCDIAAFCEQCTELEELAVATPMVELDETGSLAPNAFANSLIHLARLTKLRLLKIINLPRFQCDIFFSQTFRQLPFGQSCEGYSEVQDSRNKRLMLQTMDIFVSEVMRQTDRFGVTHHSALRITRSEYQYTTGIRAESGIYDAY